jgi:hypothetical protein
MRKKTRKRLVTILGVAVIVAAVAGAAWWFRTPLLQLIPTPPIVVTDTDNGRTIQMLQGEHLEVRLRGNRLGLSRWEVGIPLPFLVQQGDMSFTEDSSPAHPGDGYQSIPFVAVSSGAGPLFLGYQSMSDPSGYSPSKAYHLIIVVH